MKTIVSPVNSKKIGGGFTLYPRYQSQTGVQDFVKNAMYSQFKLPITALMISLVSSCCSWKYSQQDFDFTNEELTHLGPYKTGDTIYFESNLGDIDTITIVNIAEEKEEGNRCVISKPPYHNKSIVIKHLPTQKNKWPGTVWAEEKGKEVTYQTLISISKSPVDSLAKVASYDISFKGFTTLQNTLGNSPGNIIINDKNIHYCYKVTHGYPERVISSNDIEFVYWTDKYGLTAYSSKSGETWIIKNFE